MSRRICIWAGCYSAAEYAVTLVRPCGHDHGVAPSCAVCVARRRADGQARRATECLQCGDVNKLFIVRVTDYAA